ncbi:MAG: DUF4824 family protein [Gammaproteobacteria bacterium]|nr:DUF4824 family protein [Gammaproteobacteria bacterium]MBU1491076.1 DUF4824 family protein [Gammaproteobacteria bacterium]MBU2065839.1 DUF4824 family protein [Gammaproteobacteria bacterium]MBU2141165.1 DUF4824 family protein [Gammaproteobacteria bacterium]MBU2215753.1 DUF4824 family protein [Gammaproteobacteria bacterium]
MMSRYLIAGLALIGLTNAVVLAGVVWNRQPPLDSRLHLSERELGTTTTYWHEDNSGLALRLNYRWPSRANDDLRYLPISAEKMSELGFEVPQALTEQSVQRYRRQLSRDAVLVLELNGPAYEHEVALARTAHAEALRLQKAVPDSEKLQNARVSAANALEYEIQRASRLLVVDVGLDPQVLRARYPDRQRYALVHAVVQVQTHNLAAESTDPSQPPRWTWHLGGTASAPGMQRLNLPQHWHATFAGLPLQEGAPSIDYSSRYKRFSADLAFGRRLEPWFVAFTESVTTKVQ